MLPVLFFGYPAAPTPWIAFGIASAKAALILWFFMELRQEGGLARLAAIAGFVWLAILFTLTAADYLTRFWKG
ncbi:cytochrome C oxidase subunit IV family protein [Novosphingobium aerophilum]|uniref:cytochrome C oxidase subunit IV family protein n=1 Tax=Novosphingobium aerophilum TaxID=2839843 RepID=UPI00163D4BEF